MKSISLQIPPNQVKSGDHVNAAQMLLRVAQNINLFPSHKVPILTSVVVECQRANLKEDAYFYAKMLMQPEHRPQISETYKRKIEAIVRKYKKGIILHMTTATTGSKLS